MQQLNQGEMMGSLIDRCAELEAEEARKRAETRDKRKP